MQYDFENLLDDIKAVIVDNLNTKLAGITAEKNDGITLKTVPGSAYFLQDLNEEAANFDPFIVYGIEDIETIGEMGFSAENLIINIVICVGENGVSNINRKMFRYSRALKEIFEENWQNVNNSVKLTINRSMPISFKLLGSDESFKAVGVHLEASLAN